MSYMYFRFFLDDSKALNTKDHVKQYQSILDKQKESGFIRASFDFSSLEKSISILCESQNDIINEKNRWNKYLLESKIKLNEKIEYEVLEEEESHPITCLHGHDCSNEHHHEHHHHKHHIDEHHHHEHHHHEHNHHEHNHHEHNHHEHDHDHNIHVHHHHEHLHHEHNHQHKHNHQKDDNVKHKHQENHEQHQHENHWIKAAVGIIFGIGLLALSIASFNIPMIAYYIISGISSLVTLYLGHKVYQSAWQSLKENKWSMARLYTISTLAILVVSILSLFVPGLPMMLESAPLILGLWHLGESIEHTLLDKINEKLDVRDCTPESVLLGSNPSITVSVKHLIPNDIIIVNGGEVIAVDGILQQPALLYTTRVDGSPYLKQFNAGDAVKAGMCLASHIPTLEVLVTKTYQNSYLSLIAKNINQANDEKAPIEEFANKILKYFVPSLLAVAITAGVIIGILFPPALAIQCVIAILVSACPCALSLITPMAVRIGMNKASENGVHYKHGKALQSAADIDTVVFDLNGTLTQGEISVKSMKIKDKKLLKFIATLEDQSHHPVAKTIKNHILHSGGSIDNLLKVTNVDQSHHSGIKGVIDGKTFMVGNCEMLRENGIKEIPPPYDNPENGTIYMVKGSRIIGQIALTDRLRKDAIVTVRKLKSMGKQVHICTGADIATAKLYANWLGIPDNNICANTVGAASHNEEVSKESYIKGLQKLGHKVAMVGDAANDLTAIASADAGIAVKSNIGDTLTEQHAGMVVQKGLLFPIALAFDVATKTKQNIYQNLVVSLTYNSAITLVAAGLFIVVGFALNPALGVALMILESAIVLANLYRLKQQKTLSVNSSNENEFSDEQQTNNTTSEILNSLSIQPQASINLSQESKAQSVSEHSNEAASYTRQPRFFDKRTKIDTTLQDNVALGQTAVSR